MLVKFLYVPSACREEERLDFWVLNIAVVMSEIKRINGLVYLTH